MVFSVYVSYVGLKGDRPLTVVWNVIFILGDKLFICSLLNIYKVNANVSNVFNLKKKFWGLERNLQVKSLIQILWTLFNVTQFIVNPSLNFHLSLAHYIVFLKFATIFINRFSIDFIKFKNLRIICSLLFFYPLHGIMHICETHERNGEASLESRGVILSFKFQGKM